MKKYRALRISKSYNTVDYQFSIKTTYENSQILKFLTKYTFIYSFEFYLKISYDIKRN